MLRRTAFLTASLVSLVSCGDDATTTSTTTSTTSDGGGTTQASTSSSGGGATTSDGGASTTSDGGSTTTDGGGGAGGGTGGAAECGTPTECADTWEQNAIAQFDSLQADQAGLSAFITAMPKGGDLHNHMTGAVYAETYLTLAKADNDCIDTNTHQVKFGAACNGAGVQPVPTSGAFYDDIVRAWSMKDFVRGAETGHDHFFATFGKFGAVAGFHRNEDLADIATRAASENQLYVETMFNLAKNMGDLSMEIWVGSLTANDLPGLYNSILASPKFQSRLDSDVAVVDQAYANYRTALGCTGANQPPGCAVGMRFVAQVARTGAKDVVFGQLIGAFEMAKHTDEIVALNLSSPEDDTTSINNYNLHMQMLDFLYTKYKVTQTSPLHITLHAGELTSEFLPNGSTANTFHIRDAINLGHAERIGHGLDVLSETNAAALLQEMHDKNVMVEVCLSSNTQILKVDGANHPLSAYMQNDVPFALATDDQGVSRSSMAGEYVRAVSDQGLGYLDLKKVARTSLEHAFLPGQSLWIDFPGTGVMPVAACEATDTMGIGDPADTDCQAFLDANEKAKMQWALEGKFRTFESAQ